MLDGSDDDTARRLGAAGADVDVVIDYLWGEPTAAAMAALVTGRADRRRSLTWIEIGSVAGATAMIPSAALRAGRLQIVGSGQSSVTTSEILAEPPELAHEISNGLVNVETSQIPLADVENAWAESAITKRRIVITP